MPPKNAFGEVWRGGNPNFPRENVYFNYLPLNTSSNLFAKIAENLPKTDSIFPNQSECSDGDTRIEFFSSLS
jgi:hypothetical protein